MGLGSLGGSSSVLTLLIVVAVVAVVFFLSFFRSSRKIKRLTADGAYDADVAKIYRALGMYKKRPTGAIVCFLLLGALILFRTYLYAQLMTRMAPITYLTAALYIAFAVLLIPGKKYILVAVMLGVFVALNLLSIAEYVNLAALLLPLLWLLLLLMLLRNHPSRVGAIIRKIPFLRTIFSIAFCVYVFSLCSSFSNTLSGLFYYFNQSAAASEIYVPLIMSTVLSQILLPLALSSLSSWLAAPVFPKAAQASASVSADFTPIEENENTAPRSLNDDSIWDN